MVMADDNIYVGLSLVGNLRTIAQYVALWINNLTSPEGREPMIDMSNRRRRLGVSPAFFWVEVELRGSWFACETRFGRGESAGWGEGLTMERRLDRYNLHHLIVICLFKMRIK